MTGIEVLLAGGALAAKESLEKLVGSLYEAAEGGLKAALKKLKTERRISQLFTQVAKVRRVKTLGQLDRAVDLMSFYCDSHVVINGRKRKITALNDFPQGENILIEGIAGQGKSIFLRYLCAVELYRGECLPVFIELRKLSKTNSLTSHVLQTLQTYGLDLNRAQFKELANTGRLVLLLDAFDEVSEDLKEEVIHDIEQLTLQHDRLRVLVTSRPESGVHACSTFTNVKLSNLDGDEFAHVINKITGDPELEAQLIDQVKRHKGKMKGLLQTPLLVTLLVIRYKSYPELPQQMSDFYDSLFQVLLQRHDGSKPGYKRQRKTPLNDMQCRWLFETFCFLSKSHKGKQLTQSVVYDLASNAIAERAYNAAPEDFLTDIVKVTCLLVKDGEEHRFIHKSIQEYFAACYIQRRPNVVAEGIYKKLFSQSLSWRFSQELQFLSEIDRYRYFKLGELAYLQDYFAIDDPTLFRKSPPLKAMSKVREVLERITIQFTEVENAYHVSAIEVPYLGPQHWQVGDVFSLLDKIAQAAGGFGKHPALTSQNAAGLKTHAVKLSDWPGPAKGLQANPPINLAQLAKDLTEEMFKIGQKALDFVEREEIDTVTSRLE